MSSNAFLPHHLSVLNERGEINRVQKGVFINVTKVNKSLVQVNFSKIQDAEFIVQPSQEVVAGGV